MSTEIVRYKWLCEPYGESWWLSLFCFAYTLTRIHAYQSQIDGIPILLGIVLTLIFLYKVKKVREQDAIILTSDTMVGFAPNSQQFIVVPLKSLIESISTTRDVLTFKEDQGSEISISITRLSGADKKRLIRDLNDRLPFSVGDI